VVSAGAVVLRVLGALLLVPAVCLTLLRLLQPPTSALLTELVALTPVALPLYALTAVLLVVQLFRGVRLWVAWPLALVTGVGLVLHGWWFAPQVTGTSRPALRGADVTTVMTANAFVGQADAARILDVVAADHVDLLVVVEVTPDLLRHLEQGGVDALLPYRTGAPAGGPAGTVVFSTQPITTVRSLDTPFGCLEVRSSTGLTLLAAHPRAPTSPAGWSADHLAVSRAVAASRPDLVVGDLNATTDHRPLQRLSASGYRDAAEISNEGWQPTWPANHLGPGALAVLPPVAQLDHVLVGPAMTALDSRTVQVAGTDHLAVVARVVPVAVPGGP
jgi:endonuclease/exonuclease/phosphatase family metal-dependent hydrolase